MMRMEFIPPFRRLCAAFRVTPADTMIDVWAEQMQTLTHARWERIVEQLIAQHERFPTIAVAHRMHRELPRDAATAGRIACVVCEGTGVISSRCDAAWYTWRCAACTNGHGRYDALPVWSADAKTRGHVVQFACSEWDATNELQLRGLLFLGESSAAWRHAPLAVQGAARAYRARTGWAPTTTVRVRV